MAMWGRMLGRGGRSPHYDRGIRLFDQGLYEQAIEAFRLTLDEPRGGPLVERLARFYLAESHSALALAQMTNRAEERAIDNLRQAITISPNYADLHYHLGCAYQNQNEITLAIPAFERALEINPGYARARLQLGVALYQIGRRSEGLDAAEDAVALDSSLNQHLLTEARKADEDEDTDTALGHLRRIGETDGDEAMFHARLALDLFRRGMLEEAIDEYKQALAINPNYADLRNQLGVTLFAARRDEEAVAEFAHALKINPRYVEARLNHGLALRRLGRKEEARAEFTTILTFDPDNQVAQEGLQTLDEAVAMGPVEEVERRVDAAVS
jgi:tetratricopeptide (TPR) repeat protein